jgi:hypothetical protein
MNSMAQFFRLRLLLIASTLIVGRANSLANSGNPKPYFHLRYDINILRSFCDTVPENKKENGDGATNKQPSQIKEVPKSRKQPAPIAVPGNMTNVKPIKVIKPKIIKPIIKIN